MIARAGLPPEQSVHRGETLRLDLLAHGVLWLTLTRPQARNAINAAMIAEFETVFTWMDDHGEGVRLLLLQGEGGVFCAGADLAYMQTQAAMPEGENLEDALRLGRIFHRLAACPVPVVCHVQGAALGGGLGLAACSDHVLAQADAIFATPEVRLGLVAAVIGPYVVRKLGLAHAAPMMQMGARLSAQEAFQAGLVQRIVHATEDPEGVLAEVIQSFLQGGPRAVRRTRELLRLLAPLPDPGVIEASARILAQVRASDEARVGLEARAAKVLPPWAKGAP